MPAKDYCLELLKRSIYLYILVCIYIVCYVAYIYFFKILMINRRILKALEPLLCLPKKDESPVQFRHPLNPPQLVQLPGPAGTYLSQSPPFPHCRCLAAIHSDTLLLAGLAGPGEAGTR